MTFLKHKITDEGNEIAKNKLFENENSQRMYYENFLSQKCEAACESILKQLNDGDEE
jgi:hypothetical protein